MFILQKGNILQNINMDKTVARLRWRHLRKTELFDRYAQVVFGSPSHNAMSSGLLKQLVMKSMHWKIRPRVIWLSSQGDKTFVPVPIFMNCFH